MLIPIINRCLLIIKGPDCYQFLQDLITNDIFILKDHPALYTLLLSPQGRFLHDFIITAHYDSLRLEVETSRFENLKKLLMVYKLRSKVIIDDNIEQWRILAWLGSLESIPIDLQAYAYQDPRYSALGYRLIIPIDHPLTIDQDFESYDIHRLKLGIPDGSRDMQPDKAIPLEFGMDHLHAINWHKGCYLGQELTARTKHRGIVRKGIFPARFKGLTPEYATKITIDDYEIGHTLSTCQDWVLCRLHTDHGHDLFSEDHALCYTGGTLQPYPPAWLSPQ